MVEPGLGSGVQGLRNPSINNPLFFKGRAVFEALLQLTQGQELGISVHGLHGTVQILVTKKQKSDSNRAIVLKL